MGVPFEELDGSPRFRIAPGGTTATRRFKVAWGHWQAFARELLGVYRIVAGGFHFVVPSHMLLPNLVVSDLAVDPWPEEKITSGSQSSLASSANDYDFAIVTANYRTLYDVDNRPRDDLPAVPDGTILTYSGELASELMSTPGRTWRWDVNGAPLPDDLFPGLVIPNGEHTLHWQRVALPPWSAIRRLRGRVNDATFLSAAAGTVLFLGARATRAFQFLEEGGFWSIEYSFAEKSAKSTVNPDTAKGWNHLYRDTASAGEHWLAIEDADGNSPYAAGNFATLFEFGTP